MTVDDSFPEIKRISSNVILFKKVGIKELSYSSVSDFYNLMVQTSETQFHEIAGSFLLKFEENTLYFLDTSNQEV